MNQKQADMNATEGDGDSPPSQVDTGPGVVVKIILAELALVALIAVGVAALIRGASGADPSDAFAASPPATVSLAVLPSTMADIYQYAADHSDHFAQLPCYCGCEHSLGHRNLEDCFVNAVGGGWDAHASGCGVCTAEAVTARELLDTNTEIDTVRQAIVDRYGPPPAI